MTAPPGSENPAPESNAPTRIRFPTDIAIKAMGLAEEDFETLVLDLVCPALLPETPTRVSRRISSGDKYLSVSIHFTARSHDQLVRIYTALRAEPRVLYTL